MIALEKLEILIRSQKLPKNVGDLGKLIFAKALKKAHSPINAQSGHTVKFCNIGQQFLAVDHFVVWFLHSRQSSIIIQRDKSPNYVSIT